MPTMVRTPWGKKTKTKRDYAESLAEFIIHAYRFITFFHIHIHILPSYSVLWISLFIAFLFYLHPLPSKQTLCLARRHDVLHRLSFYKCHFPSHTFSRYTILQESHHVFMESHSRFFSLSILIISPLLIYDYLHVAFRFVFSLTGRGIAAYVA